MILFLIGLHRILVVLFLGRERIDITEFEETEVLALAIHIVLNAFHTTEQQCLSHDIQISRQGVHNVHEGIVLAIVSTLGQGVVQYLIEALTNQLLTHEVSQLMLLVFVALDNERALQLGGNLHIVVSIDTQDILHNIAGTLYIDAVGRNLERESLSGL